MSAWTLTLDATAKPIALVPVETAVSRVALALVEGTRDCQVIVADESRRFRSQYLDLPAPVIVLWPGYVELGSEERRRVSRRVLFARDGYRCQYCGFVAPPGKAFRYLTIDHVKPARLFAYRSEATNWENVTTACAPCNRRKGGRLPWEAGMMPATVPRPPHYVQLRFAGRLNQVQRDYVRDFFKLDRRGEIVI